MRRPVPEAAALRPVVTLGPAAVVHADFDGDGALDIAVVDPAGGTVLVWMGDRESGFKAAAPPWPAASAPLDAPPAEPLTQREVQVAGLMAAGYTDREIADMLCIGHRTVETHAANVRGKLGLRSRRELIRRWRHRADG